jgi:hypothetical protein
VTVACERRGRGCPFRSKVFKPTGPDLDLRKVFRKALRRGTSVTITITRRGMTGEVVRFMTRRRGAPRKKVRHLT